MEKLDLGYETLKQRNPALIFASGSGFGQTGPYTDKPALDVTIQALGGIMSITGEEGGPPVRPGISLGDISAGLFLCTAILAALYDAIPAARDNLSISACWTPRSRFRRTLSHDILIQVRSLVLWESHPVFTPFQAFETSDGYIALASRGEGMTNGHSFVPLSAEWTLSTIGDFMMAGHVLRIINYWNRSWYRCLKRRRLKSGWGNWRLWESPVVR